MSAPVLVLMYIMAPVAWPTAKLLDKLLGTDHGTTYKKAGLKTLVTLHKTLGEAGEQLNSDEVTIISAVLDLKDKPVGAIMTPMDNVFTMSANTILDEETMDIILSAGYSRIPIHDPENPLNFIGMLLVKMLITYDPEDAKPVRDFALATLPETRPETSCLDIVNYFQEGKSHMVLVTDAPGEDYGALGVVTLEDVIEELIGEEIIDESDVFVDVHKAVRRLQPTPWTRLPRGSLVAEPPTAADNEALQPLIKFETNGDASPSPSRGSGLKRHASEDGPAPPGARHSRKLSSGEASRSPLATVTMRRSSSVTGHSDGDYITKRIDALGIKDHLKHLGPSNLASRPKSTRYASVKIKQSAPGGAQQSTRRESIDAETAANTAANANESTALVVHPPAASGGVGEGLLNSAGMVASDGVQAVQAGYGTLTSSSPVQQRLAHPPPPHPEIDSDQPSEIRRPGTSEDPSTPSNTTHQRDSRPSSHSRRHHAHSTRSHRSGAHHSRQNSGPQGHHPYLHASAGDGLTPSQQSLQQHLTTLSTPQVPRDGHGSGRHHSRTHSTSTLESLQSIDSGRGNGGPGNVLRISARSGSITENIVEHGGFRKVVLEMTSSSSSEEEAGGDDENAAGQAQGDGEAVRARHERRADSAAAATGGSGEGSDNAGAGTASAATGSSASAAHKKHRRSRRRRADGSARGAPGHDNEDRNGAGAGAGAGAGTEFLPLLGK